MSTSKAKFRTAVLLLAVAALAATAFAACTILDLHWSPRLEIFRPHIRADATRGDFERLAREHDFLYEIEGDNPKGDMLIPLDGSRYGQRLRLSFFADGALRSASVIAWHGRPTDRSSAPAGRLRRFPL